MVEKRKRGVYRPRVAPTTRRDRPSPPLAFPRRRIQRDRASPNSFFSGAQENAVVGRAACKLVVNRVYGDYLCSVFFYSRLSLFAAQLAFLADFFFSHHSTPAAITTIKRKDFTRAWNESPRRSVSACVGSETPGLPVSRVDGRTLSRNIF